MNKQLPSKIKISRYLISLSVTLILYFINVTFELMAQFHNRGYSSFLFGGATFKEMLENIFTPLCIPYWFYLFVALVYGYHLVWIIYSIVQVAAYSNFEVPLITIIAGGLSFTCDTLWIVYFMRLDLLPSIIINLTHLILLVVGALGAIYVIQRKKCHATTRVIIVNRGLILGAFMANIAWVFYRFIFEFGVTLQMALMMAEIFLPYEDVLYTVIPLSMFTGLYLVVFVVEIFCLNKALRYNVSSYLVYIVVFSGVIAKNYTGQIDITWETVAIITTFTVVVVTSVIKFILVGKEVPCNKCFGNYGRVPTIRC